MLELQKLPNHIARYIYPAEIAKWQRIGEIQVKDFADEQADHICSITASTLKQVIGDKICLLIPEYSSQNPKMPQIFLLKPENTVEILNQLVSNGQEFSLTLDQFGFRWQSGYTARISDNHEYQIVHMYEYGNGPLEQGLF